MADQNYQNQQQYQNNPYQDYNQPQQNNYNVNYDAQQQPFQNNQQGQPYQPQQQYPVNQDDNSQNLLGNPQQKNDEKQGGLLGSHRLGFIRKVFLIFTAQMLFTVGITAISMSSYSFANFQFQNYWLMIVLCFFALFIEIAIICYRQIGRTVPYNYICLGLFTFCWAWMISFICAAVGQAYPDDGYIMVFAAAGLTTAMFAALTIYALTTKTDYTYCGGFLWSLFFTFALFGIFCAIWPTYWDILLYCSIGIVLISFYFIYDIQIICGKGYWKLDVDDYIIGSLIIYIDFIYLFLRILQILLIARR